jgi:DNA-binding response OmpR family regulator
MDNDQILIVDGHALSRKYLKVLLGSAGYVNVLTADNATEARRLICRGHIKLALIDMRLVDSSGFLLVRELRAQRGTQDLAIVGMGADRRTMIRTAALDAGCDRYFEKPLNADALLAAVADYLDPKSRWAATW